MIKIYFLALILFLSACSEQKSTQVYDGKKLLETKCASCHNLDMPPTLFKDELAPPMMAVGFHVKSFVEPKNESQRESKSIAFVVDYVQNPSLEKSFCDKESLKRYGMMPSQKENVSVDETKAIAEYMFKHFTQENLSKIQKQKAAFDKLSDGDKLAIKHRCIGCHKDRVDTVGPSLVSIAKRYKNSNDTLKSSIKNGSRGKWNRGVMPAFKQLNEEELQTLSVWVLEKGDEATEKK